MQMLHGRLLKMAKDFVPNKEQEEVIDHKDGPLLVLAGPGSGKH